MLGLTGLNLALSYSPLPESLWYFSYETSLKLMCYNYDNFLLVWYHQSAADMPLTFCATLSGWWMNRKVFTQLHSLMKSTFLLRKDLWWLWNKQNNAHTPPPMWNLSSCIQLVRYHVEHSKEYSVCTHSHVLFLIWLTCCFTSGCTWDGGNQHSSSATLWEPGICPWQKVV